jgi:hypothetical protein
MASLAHKKQQRKPNLKRQEKEGHLLYHFTLTTRPH